MAVVVFNLQGQVKKEELKTDTVDVPLYQGFRIETDLVPLVGIVSGSESFSYEAAIQFYLKNKFYPIAEIGYGGADKTVLSGIRSKSSGMFYRLGLDFNLMKPKPDAKPTHNLLLVGARLGFSGYSYDLYNLQFAEEYWSTQINKNMTGLNDFRLWIELAASLRVEISKNIFIGWNIKRKSLLIKDVSGEFKSWYIPGYGISNESAYAFNYVIGYKF
jgi:hypothetical protein